ncbi:hypothetical protein LSM04_003813 [Trypanosoma melophagium]|uniref:uncharacterized protein n=1 Tax=Trypanosoma melophagium TaxID=715481 RepID=UPI00351A89DD|nr:hypothetical protein LSM04_003813 [Trypanosoma melophagium]
MYLFRICIPSIAPFLSFFDCTGCESDPLLWPEKAHWKKRHTKEGTQGLFPPMEHDGAAITDVNTSTPSLMEMDGQLTLFAQLRVARQQVHRLLQRTEDTLQQATEIKWMYSWTSSA